MPLRPHNRLRKFAMLLAGSLVSLGGLGLTGCGGSSATRPSTQTAVLASGPTNPEGAAGASGGQARLHIARGVAVSKPRVQRARLGPNDERGATVTQLNPCTLVKQAEVEAASHVTIASSVEAPLGPTCIFRPSGGRPYITIAIEPSSRQLGSANRLQRVTVAGHTAYCVTFGRSTLVVPLRNRMTLKVAAPCPIAAQLAIRAISRIRA